MHWHAPSEIYYVLDGEFAFYAGDADGGVRRIVARSGDGVPLAGGVPHTIRNEGDREAIAFVVHSSSAVAEGFSRAAAALADQGAPTMADVLALAQRHGVELLGPAPTRT